MSQRQPGRKKTPRQEAAEKRTRQAPVGRPAFLSDREKGTRLQKFLANAGIDSRRNCEQLIRDGRVTVDGQVVSDPAVSVHPEEQDVRLDGEVLRLPKFRYYLVNKPKGVVCTNHDPAGRPRAVDLVPDLGQKLFTVGRLDENTQGLLLITNDGALAEHLAHPRYEVIRRYRVQVAGIPEGETLAELRHGMHFSDGFFRFRSIRPLKRKGRSMFLELELQEGKNREIRRLLARVGHKVIQLERIGFGPLRLGRLAVGEHRELGSKELHELYVFLQTAPSVRNAPKGSRSKHAAGNKTGPRKKAAAKNPAGRQPAAEAKSRRGAARHTKPPKATEGRAKTSRKQNPRSRKK
ncbi:MAG: pseudouridine synthase [Fuerstiella sp.]